MGILCTPHFQTLLAIINGAKPGRLLVNSVVHSESDHNVEVKKLLK